MEDEKLSSEVAEPIGHVLQTPRSADNAETKESDAEDSHFKEEGGIDPNNEITGVRLVILHLGLCLCTFTVGLDFNIIATAIPSITSQFHSVPDVGWYGAALFLALCASQPLTGKTFTLFPMKVVYLVWVAVFEVGSLVCALAPSSKALIVGRALAGVGSSGIFAGGQIIITTVIPLHKRAVWQGAIISTFAFASVVGPVIGGALTQNLTWRWCFYINLPIGGFSAMVVLWFLDIRAAPSANKTILQKLRLLDILGFVLFAGSIIMLLLALQWGGTTYPWDTSVIIGLLVGFAPAMALFIIWEIRLKDNALIPPRIFANRNFLLIGISGLFSSGAFQVVVYWLPIWFQAVIGVPPMESGVRYLAVVLSEVLTSFIGPAALQYMGYWNPFLLLGFALVSVGCGFLTTLYPGISDGHWIGYEILCGCGYSLILTNINMSVQASLPTELVPLGSVTLNLILSASSAIWLAVGQAIFQGQLRNSLVGSLTLDQINAVLSAGATQLRSIAGLEELPEVIDAYSSAIATVFYVPAACQFIAFLAICGARWTSVKKHG